jgi:hypothetical protein
MAAARLDGFEGLGVDGEGLEDSYWAKRVTETEGEWAGWTRHPGGDPFETWPGRSTTASGRRRPRLRLPGRAQAPERRRLPARRPGDDLRRLRPVRDRPRPPGRLQHRDRDLQRELVGTAREGALVECSGDVVKAGRSMIFVPRPDHLRGEPVCEFLVDLKKTTRGVLPRAA